MASADPMDQIGQYASCTWHIYIGTQSIEEPAERPEIDRDTPLPVLSAFCARVEM